MSTTGHPNEKVNGYILDTIGSIEGLNLVSCESKESIVLEEKEITWIYIFNKDNSGVNVIITVSDPIYFCNVSFAKNENDHFSLKPFLGHILNKNDLEDLFNDFIDEKVDDEDYTMKFLNTFKKYSDTEEVKKVMSGEYWPDVPSEE